MPKVTVRKCPKTGKVFFGDDEYAKYIVDLRQRLTMNRIARRERDLIRERLWYSVGKITSPNVLASYVKKHIHDIMIAYNGGRPEIHELVREMELLEFRFVVNYREHCTNSHVAPRDGETNWSGRDDTMPTGYPGYTGQISYKLKGEPKSSDPRLVIPGTKSNRTCLDFHDGLKYIGINTNSGSGRRDKDGILHGGYGVTMFLSDFDAMKKAYFKSKLEDKSFIPDAS